VVSVGEGVTNVKPGDRCSVEPYINCRTCYSCRRGHFNCCENHMTLGVMCDGGLAELFTLPARKLHVSETLSYDQLALVETLAIGCHAVNRAAPKPGETVLVIGSGPIGLSAIEFVKVAAAQCVVMDVNADRLRFCKDVMKVDHVIAVKGDGSELTELAAITSDQLADVVIDATGSQKSMSGCFQYAAFAGRVVYVGITREDLVFPHAPIVHRRELTILASRNALPDDFTRIIRLIEEGVIDTKPWITHHARFDDLIATFPDWLKPASGVIKAVVDVT
jgi:2-desacetyl-2-hydroxyethyl bacteriochlorophyllide A dehydrogenase